ncbi:MAG: DNA polymerase/3'-5' exonuclease PolX [Candidatus Thermoplasmatota archaeon]|nr:DNA polymerase/3'-5' exonuclease PolX [Candidatus Thermoplasmatota archaeon]
MENADVAEVFYEVADLLDLQDVSFKPVAYRRAARNIESLDEDITKLVDEGRVRDIPGVGEAIADKVEELVRTGRLGYLEKLRSQVPPGLVELLRVPDVGPKTARVLHSELGISSLEELKQAVGAHRLRGLKGFGEKTEERILQGIAALEAKGQRTLLGEALPIAEAYLEYLKSAKSLDRISIAGSLRRGRETVGDIDIVVGDDEPAAIMDAFVSYPEVQDVLMKGPTRSSVRLRGGLQVDLRAVETRSWGAALCYLTGSKEHNVYMRRVGVEMGLKLNEYGLFERASGKMVAGKTEEELYEALGFGYIEPELRENSGEFDASKKGALPELVKPGDIKGDFHVHTDWSDGANSIPDVARAASDRGYEFVAVTDHSQSLKIAGGLSPEKLRQQISEIRKLESASKLGIRVLAGTEVDIKADGSLDFPPSLLKDLDIVIGSVHSRFKMEKAEMTKRVVRAVESGQMDILGHPTGRLIGERAAYQLDMQQVLQAARSSGVLMEINSFPNRLDLGDIHCRMAKEAGVRVAIGTDSHHVEHMGYMRLGVITARRGWLERGDVLNTSRVGDLLRTLKGRRP